jgi:hypothetical protein
MMASIGVFGLSVPRKRATRFLGVAVSGKAPVQAVAIKAGNNTIHFFNAGKLMDSVVFPNQD